MAPACRFPVLIQNNYGGSLGGPIKRNKIFFFGNYQGIRTHAQGVQNTTVPTATAKAGIFQWLPAGGTVQQYSIVNNDPLHKGIDPTVASLLSLFPAPNNPNVGDGLNSAGYQFNFPNNSLSDQFTIKMDYNFSDRIHFFERTSWQRNSSVDSLNGAQNVIPGLAPGTQGGKRWGVAAGMDWTLSDTMVNEFRYGHQSASTNFNRPEREDGPQLSFNTFTTPILTAFGQGRNSPVNEYTDNLTKVHGKHTLKFGGQLRFTDQYGFNDAGIYPNISLSTANGNVPAASVSPAGLTASQLTTFQGLYNDLLGRISSVTETFYSNLNTFQAPGTPRVRNFIYHEYGFFAQDDWRITPRLTLNAGLRWEFYPVPYELNGQQGILTPQSVLNVGSQADNLTVQASQKWYKNDWHSFAPRFGFAWDPWGDGKTAIRGGYGIFNDRIVGAASGSIDGGTPGFSQASSLFPNSARNGRPHRNRSAAAAAAGRAGSYAAQYAFVWNRRYRQSEPDERIRAAVEPEHPTADREEHDPRYRLCGESRGEALLRSEPEPVAYLQQRLPARVQSARGQCQQSVGGSVVEPDCRHLRIGFGGDLINRRE